jgi:hypothetical protein
MVFTGTVRRSTRRSSSRAPCTRRSKGSSRSPATRSSGVTIRIILLAHRIRGGYLRIQRRRPLFRSFFFFMGRSIHFNCHVDSCVFIKAPLGDCGAIFRTSCHGEIRRDFVTCACACAGSVMRAARRFTPQRSSIFRRPLFIFSLLRSTTIHERWGSWSAVRIPVPG